MIIINQEIKLTKRQVIPRKHFDFFLDKGYNFNNGYIIVPINDLPKDNRSTYSIKVICNYCKKEFLKKYIEALNDENHCCSSGKCIYKKASETNKQKYGVINPSQREEVKNKKEKTFIERYGVNNAYQISEVRQNTREKLGVDYPFQCNEIREKQKQTMIDKYGIENPGQMNGHKEKCVNTFLQNFGVEHPMKIPEINRQITIKMLKTMSKNGTGMCSSQQRHIHTLINGELNYPIDECQLDIAFPQEKIYVEYDGGGHDFPVKIGKVTREQFNLSERKRYEFLKSLGWKLIRIVCIKDKLYNDDKMIFLINESKNYLLNSDRNWIEINIDQNKVLSKELNKDIL